MAGPNLEIFKFGIYIMFPIAWMYYFGTNLEERFTVPDFWPKPEATYKIPFEKSEIHGELERLKARRLEKRAERLEREGDREGAEKARKEIGQIEQTKGVLGAVKTMEEGKGSSWWGWGGGKG